MGDDTAAAVAGAWNAVDQAERDRAVAPSPESDDRLVAALLAVADTCRSRTRDEFPEITTAAQLAECRRVVDGLADVPVTDPGLARRVSVLEERVRAARGYVWPERVRTAVLALVAVAVAVGGAVLSALDGNVPSAVTLAVLGSGALFAIILTARRPAWLLRAERVRPMVRHHGLQASPSSSAVRVSAESGTGPTI